MPFGLSLPLEDVACAALFAFFAMQGSIPGIAPAQALEITGSAPTIYTTVGGILTQATANGVLLLLLSLHPRLMMRHWRAVPCAALLGALAVASTAWSIDPALTLRRSIPFALAGLFGLWFAARFSLRRQLAILHLTMVALSLATIAMVLLAPSFGLDHTPGHPTDWQGVFTQKNACGRIMVLATAVILFGHRITVARMLSLALSLLVLAMSGSRGAWIIEAAVLLLWAVMWFARRCGSRLRLFLAVAAPAVIAIVMAAAVLLFPHLMLLLGRDNTLSGRTAIWTEVGHFIRLRPLLGYGYDAFWRGMQGPSLEVDAAVHFVVEHAHNGFLEIWLELGVAGLGLFLLSWLGAWWRLWPLWQSGDLQRIAFPMATLVLIALYDLDENTLLIYNGLFWVLYVAALANIEFAAREPRHTGSPPSHAILIERLTDASKNQASIP